MLLKRCFLISFILSILFLSPAFSGQISKTLSQRLYTLDVSERISVVIYMKEKPSTENLPTGIKDKILYLQNFSNMSQEDLMKYLSQKQVEGKASDINSFWTFNGLGLTADKSVIEEISKRNDVEKIDINRTYFLPKNPEKYIGVLSVKTSSSTIEPNIEQIRAQEVWTGYNIKGKGIKIGVADTGCRSDHPDLAGKIVKQASFDDKGNKISDTAPDTDGHGTHVAGIIAGGNTSGSYIGVAPQSDLLIAKIFSDAKTSSFNQTVKGIEWLISNEAKIANLSLGSDATGEADASWKSIVDSWNLLGVTIVSAIGNYGPNPKTTASPGNVPNALGVGAVDREDLITEFSARGPITWDNTVYIKPDIVAPGRAIKSAATNNSYVQFSGTSMACPHVSGVAALMLEANSSLTPAAIKRILKDNTHKKEGLSYPNNNYGWGRVDAFAAVTNARDPDTTPPVIIHAPITLAKFGENLLVSAVVSDEITTSPTVTLYYRDIFNVWQSAAMSKNLSTYSALIADTKTKMNFNYYIEAKDLAKNTSTSPSDAPNNSYSVSVSSQETTYISENQTSPNPFSPGQSSIAFTFYLSKSSLVILRIYSITGEVKKTFNIDGNLGYNQLLWDGTFENSELVSNGIYPYQISLKDPAITASIVRGKIIVLK